MYLGLRMEETNRGKRKEFLGNLVENDLAAVSRYKLFVES